MKRIGAELIRRGHMTMLTLGSHALGQRVKYTAVCNVFCPSCSSIILCPSSASTTTRSLCSGHGDPGQSRSPSGPQPTPIHLVAYPTFLCPPPAMLLSPNSDYVSFRQSKRDSSMSPCRASSPLFHRTPPNSKSSLLAYDTPMLSPSPLRRQALPTPGPVDPDDVFQSPLRAYNLFVQRSPQLPPDSSMVIDDEDDLFLGPSPSSSSHYIPPSSPALRTPLRTPVKDSSQDPLGCSPDRAALSVKHLNVAATLFSSASAGMKRKPTPICTTPSRSRTMTPLGVTSTATRTQEPAALFFDRLAPLPAPRFDARTPHTKAETEQHLRRQAETMTMLSIRDLDHSGDESGYDSDPDANGTIEKQSRLFMGGAGGSAAPFSSIKARQRTKATVKGKSPGLEILTRAGLVNDEEVAEAISPGGHVTKRRARSRPVSSELLESVQSTPVVSHNQVSHTLFVVS